MTTPKQSIAFPDAALIRKGTPKQKMTKNGKDLEIQGKNLDGKGFRIHFAPGTENAVAAWEINNASRAVTYDPAQYVVIPGEKNYIVKEITALVPTRSVWDALNEDMAVNEAYTGGRRFALANDEQYISYRNPATGEVEIANGKPFKKFEINEVIRYERGGRQFESKIKTSVRLRLVVKDMIEQGQLVQFVLKTTSWYDWQNIKRQLAGIQAIADTTSNGNASGIPFKIFRLQQEIVWNKSDGSAQRMKQWLINIQPNPEWVKVAFARMGQYALNGSAIAGALTASNEVVGAANPEAEDDDEYDVDAEASDVESLDTQPTEGQSTQDIASEVDTEKLPSSDKELRHLYAKEATAALIALPKGTKLPGITGKSTIEDIQEVIAGIRALVASSQ